MCDSRSLGPRLDPGVPVLVLPFEKNGNIREFLKHQPSVNAMQLPQICQLALGLFTLHANDIVHGDVKPSNVLIDSNKVAHLSDVGLANILSETNVIHSLRWVAIELLQMTEDAEEVDSRPCIRFSKASDIWAFGMTALEIISGSIPFYHIRSDLLVPAAVLRGVRPLRVQYTLVPDSVWRVLEKCWATDPTQRPEMVEVLPALQACC